MIRLSVHPSRYPDASTARLRGALEARVLPGRFLYDSPAQAGRWLAYHEAYSPSRTDRDVEARYDDAFRASVQHFAGGFRVVGLGCGGGRKDARLLQTATGRASYAPIDTSPSLVVQSALEARDAASDLDPRVIDLESSVEGDAFGDPEEPRLFSAFGMIPNFELDEFGPRLGAWLRPDDFALISFNLSPGRFDEARDRILPQYDNEPGRAWMWGALNELGLFEADARLEVSARPVASSGEVWRIEAWCELERDARCPMPWGTVPFARGDRLRVLISNRLTVEAADHHLLEWGCAPVARWISESGEEGVWLVRCG